MEEVNNEKIDILNIHYYLNDGTHQLDAFIHNDASLLTKKSIMRHF